LGKKDLISQNSSL